MWFDLLASFFFGFSIKYLSWSMFTTKHTNIYQMCVIDNIYFFYSISGLLSIHPSNISQMWWILLLPLSFSRTDTLSFSYRRFFDYLLACCCYRIKFMWSSHTHTTNMDIHFTHWILLIHMVNISFYFDHYLDCCIPNILFFEMKWYNNGWSIEHYFHLKRHIIIIIIMIFF